ncbi:PREDICTED: U2 small nuclear ribonucleoprotein B''-like isoform X1 [Camelina sativa]|uniref:U2 small nuclear ribonucleoprotein B''-like isoform X1 n=1 Tax=Camelina sativa TaxID=90675 RepID=A0ABM0W3M9_CAMSA|nr:PREDICTED: U2 small nuclear ribonucleoprotein B''-like isoform X1 [Camelina sativa]XP_010465228.1 PREDICTED: U2 small nuclear ribonucleoprotein B''-like isoform X1 [Camelina sativa]
MAYHQPYDPYQVYLPHSHPHPLPPQFSDEPGAINTLFVSGLPNDVKAREIHNLFRRRHGFESCQLKYTGRGDQVVAFATFTSHGFAMAALSELNGVKFDPQTGSTLHIELARSNSRRKERPGSGPYVVIDNRNKKPSKSQDDQSDEVDSDPDEAQEPGNSDSPKENDNSKSEADSDQDSKAPSANGHLEKACEGSSGARPCSTLFIANLGPNCTEEELKQLISRYPGFNILKIRARGGMPVAFADFEEIEQATDVMNELQGYLLSSSDRGGMHIEYARSKMRKQ